METRNSISEAKRCFAAARAAAESGSFIVAEEQMEKALQLRPGFAPYWVSLGNFFRERARFQESEEAIRLAIRINSSAFYAWTELGLLFKDRGLFEEAADCLRRSVQLRPDFNTYTILARVELMFDADAALLDAEKALQLNSDWDEAIRLRDAAVEIIKQHYDN